MEIVYVMVAAAAGYVATLVHKRYEVGRAVAAEIDSAVREAYLLASLGHVPIGSARGELNDETVETILRWLHSAETRTSLLSPRVARPVADQVGVAIRVAAGLLHTKNKPGVWPSALQQSTTAVREVIAPLLLPPRPWPRRPAQPRSFPPRRVYDALLRRKPDSFLGEAVEWGNEHSGRRAITREELEEQRRADSEVLNESD